MYQEQHAENLAGTGLSKAVDDNTILRRANVVEAFLKAGVPLTKLNCLRSLLEANNLSLTYSSHMAQIVPFLLQSEQRKLKEEIMEASRIVVIFDGTTHLGEAFAILIRYLDASWNIQQRLARFHVLAKSMKAPELAREIILCLSTFFQINPSRVVAFVRDGAAVNTAALEQVMMLLYTQANDIICASHNLDNVGQRFDTPTLSEFAQWWVALFSRSPAARLAWKTRTGVSPKSHSTTRWWSLWEVLKQLLQYFGDVEPFLMECEWSPAARHRCLQVLQNQTAPNSAEIMQVELAAVVDAGEPFVRKTYILEGDGLLSLDAYSHLQEVAVAASDAYYPNVAAVVKSIAPNSPQHQAQLTTHAEDCVRPAVRYFLTKVQPC